MITISTTPPGSPDEPSGTTPEPLAAILRRKSEQIQSLEQELETYRGLLEHQDAAEEEEQTRLLRQLASTSENLQLLEHEQAAQLLQICELLRISEASNQAIKQELKVASETRLSMVLMLAAEIAVFTGLLFWF